METRHASPEVNGAALRELRKERGLTVTNVAAELGISIRYLSLIERGDRPTVSPSTFNKIVGFYQVERSTLLRPRAEAA